MIPYILGGLAVYLLFFRKPKEDNAKSEPAKIPVKIPEGESNDDMQDPMTRPDEHPSQSLDVLPAFDPYAQYWENEGLPDIPPESSPYYEPWAEGERKKE